jgi:hypothetical protein
MQKRGVFTMNPNDARIRRIYTRQQGETIVDDSLEVAVDNELVVEWEAGSQFNSLGVGLDINLVTRNISANANEAAPLTDTIAVVTDGTAANTAYTEVVAIPAGTLVSGEMYESLASLVRAASQIHSFSNEWLFLGF